MIFLLKPGLVATNSILWAASFLKNHAVPGTITIVFCIALGYCIFQYNRLIARRKKALTLFIEKQSSSQAVKQSILMREKIKKSNPFTTLGLYIIKHALFIKKMVNKL